MPTPPDLSDFVIGQTQLILSSFRQRLGRDLIVRSGDKTDEAERLQSAPFIVVSAGAEEDPILNYGNDAALRLWEMDWETLTQTPARKTAEPMHRDERATFLDQVRTNGYIKDYSGVRISSQGKRFRIEQAIVWNLQDEQGNFQGQAATFGHWTELA